MSINGITSVVTRVVKVGKEAEYEAFLKNANEISSSFQGFLGSDIFKNPSKREYTLVFKFDSQDNYQKWNTSQEKKDLLANIDELAEKTTFVQLSGLEYWFNYDFKGLTNPPQKYKMILATALGLYPLVLILPPTIGKYLGFLGTYLTTLLSVLIMLILMTYLVMPVITKILSKWLFSKS